MHKSRFGVRLALTFMSVALLPYAGASDIEITHRQQVQRLYDSPLAATPYLSEMTEGWWTGRCFKTANPSQEVASLLVAFTHSCGESALMALMAPYAAADYYDEPAAWEINGLITDRGAEITAARRAASDHSLYSVYDAGNVAYHVVQSGGYYVGRIAYQHDSVTHRAGGAWGYCYWFHRVR